MEPFDLDAALAAPTARAVLWTIGALLVLVLLRETRRVPRPLLALMASAFLDMVGLLMIVPILPFYVQKFCGDGVDVLGLTLHAGFLSGVVVSTFTAAQLLTAPMWGRFSDRRGRRPALVVALFASAVAYLVFGFADSLWLLVLSRFVQGAGGGTVGVIQAYVADSVPPEQRARALGWISAATNLGVALGPVLGALSMSLGKADLTFGAAEPLRLGEAAPGVVAALLCIANMAFSWRCLAESNERRGAHDAQRVNARTATFAVILRPSLPSSRLILTYAIAIGAFQGITGVLALFLGRRFSVDEESIGWFYMYIGAISVFARTLLLGRMVDRLGEARLSRIGLVTLSCGIVSIPLATGLPSLALAVAMLPLGTAFTFPCVTSLLSRVIEPQDRGLYMGLQQTYGGIARIAGPLFYGWAFDSLGIEAPFYVGAPLVLAVILLGIGLQVAPLARTRRP